jgi:regulator of replication initiation timing
MSNGSEHTPERPDYKARIDEARRAQAAVYLATDESVAQDISRIIKGLADAVEALLAIEQRLTNHIVQLAAERDALQVENEKLRGHLREVQKIAVGSRHRFQNAEKERDVLQSRLDAMTVETRRTRVPASQPGPVILKLLDEQRLVGPWTVVPEDTK